jgi:hypothetical protein
MAMHVFGVTDNDRLWHSILPDQTFFGDVAGTGGTGRPWRTGDTATSPTARDSACAADSEGNLHVLVVSTDGRLWHTIRARGGTWIRFGNVEAGGAGNIGTVTAVAAATEGTSLHILAVNSSRDLHKTVWNPQTPTGPARFDPPFRKVGTWDPSRGLLRTVAAAELPPPPGTPPPGPASTAQVVLDDIPVFREVAGSQPDPRVARLQQMLNQSGLGATATTGSGLLAETGLYDSATADAVRRFQAANNLPANGIMTGATWRAFLALWLSGQPTGR